MGGPIDPTSSAVLGFAAPRGTTRRRLASGDITTVAEFEDALNAAMKLLFRVPAESSCVVDTSAIQFAVSNPACTEAFRTDQLTGSFCYIFQTTISPPPGDQVIPPCEVNDLAQRATVELEDGGFEAVIGPVAGTGEVFVPTDSPTEAPVFTEPPTTFVPTEETGDPTSETVEPTSETVEPTSETEEPTSETVEPTTFVPTPGTASEYGFTTLVTALTAADLVQALSSPNGPYTVFAPTNA